MALFIGANGSWEMRELIEYGIGIGSVALLTGAIMFGQHLLGGIFG